MESQQLTNALDFDTMKQGYLRNPLDLLNQWNISIINSNKTFDYDKHTEFKPNCKRINIAPLKCTPPPPEMVPQQQQMEVKPKHKKGRRGRNKKRKKNQKMEKEASVSGDVVDCCYSPKVTFRCRLPSECESEDSFIVFEESYEKQACVSRDYESDIDCTERPEDLLSKTVRFACEEQLCQVHPMVQWSYAYRTARKGPWEQYALDRMRFQNRVNNMKPILDYVLQPAHRSQIYKDRFKELT